MSPTLAAILTFLATAAVAYAVHRRATSGRLRLQDAARRTAETEGRRLQSVLASISDGVLVTDDEGRTVLDNSLWRSFFGGATASHDASEMTRHATVERLVRSTLDSRTETSTELEIRIQGDGGVPRSLVLTAAPLQDGSGVVALARDITPFLRIAEVRRDFVANVSHELKTPLTVIRGRSETLLRGALDDTETSKRWMTSILEQCDRLEDLLQDLLTLSKMEHEGRGDRVGEVDVAWVVESAAREAAERAAARDIRLETDLGSVSSVDGNEEALERACRNLLENAVNYSHAGDHITARTFEHEGDAVVEVADTGIGIPADALDRIFERFYRVDKGRSRREGGTGLGLAIVKHTAQLHGGSVEVESTLGVGSTFRIRLPVSDPESPTPPAPEALPV